MYLKISKKVDKYNLELAGLQADKQKRIKEATIPVEGIEFDGETIKYFGIEFRESAYKRSAGSYPLKLSV